MLFRYRPSRKNVEIFDPLKMDGRADGNEKKPSLIAGILLDNKAQWLHAVLCIQYFSRWVNMAPEGLACWQGAAVSSTNLNIAFKGF